MAHVPVPPDVPGIRSLFAYSPTTAKPLCELAEVLLRGPSTLTTGERELIASYVSYLNQCVFCTSSHSAAAKHLLGGDGKLVESVKTDYHSANISEKMKVLLNIAAKVQKGKKSVTKNDVQEALNLGASHLEIHHTVLIASAFCMYNRYVDGLDTLQPEDPKAYDEMGKELAEKGYIRERSL